MPENLTNPLPAPPERELYTPKAVQIRVMARHVAGESNRQIAIQEGLDRETVHRILTQQELVELIAEQQTQLLLLGSKAIAVYQEALECQDLGIAVATATKILEGTGVMDKQGLQRTIDVALDRFRFKQTPHPAEFDQGFLGHQRPRKRTPRKPTKAELTTARQCTADKMGVSPSQARKDVPSDNRSANGCGAIGVDPKA